MYIHVLVNLLASGLSSTMDNISIYGNIYMIVCAYRINEGQQNWGLKPLLKKLSPLNTSYIIPLYTCHEFQ